MLVWIDKFPSVIGRMQNISSMSEMDTVNLLKNNTVISVEISKFNNHLMERLSSRGDDAIVVDSHTIKSVIWIHGASIT